MPRELGLAKRADLTGHFPGEPSEQVSSLTNFLVQSSQIAPPEAGTHGGNGKHGTDTEVSGRQTEVPMTRQGTEVSGRLHPGGNGVGGDTVFDTPLAALEMEPEAMEPEPLLSPEPMDAPPEPARVMQQAAPARGLPTEALRPPPVAPPAPALSPAEPELMAAEPEALDSIPDFASPEHDAPLQEEDDGGEPVTDKLPPRPANRPVDLPPPANAGDTGMLTMEAESLPADERLTLDELRADEDTHLQVGADPSEKITSKVEPRVDMDPRSRDPDAVVRDTVNFYNQTQSLHQRQAAGQAKPVVEGTVPLAPRPREFEDSPSRRFTPPPPLPAQSLAAEPEALPESMSFDDDLMSPEPSPDLAADDDVDSADRKDTDRFMEDDRRPPDLPRPMGADKSAQVTVRTGAPGQLPQLDAVAPEKVAAGKDTQKFFVADILRKKDDAPAPAGSDTRSSESTTDTAFEIATAREPLPGPETVEPDLPQPDDVEKDFDSRYFGRAEERIIPEFDGVPEEARGQAESDQGGVERITEKVQKAAEAAAPEPAPAARHAATASGRPAMPSSAGRMPATGPRPAAIQQVPPPARPAPVAASRRGPAVTDEVSRRLAAEREETLRLLQTAEELAARLRDASSQSRTDLLAISSRRRAVPMAEAEQPELPGPDDSAPTRILSARDHGSDERPTTPVPQLPEEAAAVAPSPVAAQRPTHSRRERVPTQAIGDILGAIESKLGAHSAPLSDLLQEASRRITTRIEAEQGGNGHSPDEEHLSAEEIDIDALVAASASWRKVFEVDPEEDELPPPPVQRESVPSRVVTASPLSQDLDRIWKELSSSNPAVAPRADSARIAAPDAGPGWTQEALWKTLAGISLVTFVLGGLFVWIVYRVFSV